MSPRLDALKDAVRKIAVALPDRYDRTRRIYVQDRSMAMSEDRETEYSVKSDIHKFFDIPYSDVLFSGSTQLGFSPHKDSLFKKSISDLDVACVNTRLFQVAWVDLIEASRAFSNGAAFGATRRTDIDLFKEMILKRGMIKVSLMPTSDLSARWKDFESEMTRKYSSHFGSISFAIYMNEYAFCWKQDSAIQKIIGK